MLKSALSFPGLGSEVEQYFCLPKEAGSEGIGSSGSGVTDCCELHRVPVLILDLFLKVAVSGILRFPSASTSLTNPNPVPHPLVRTGRLLHVWR